MSRECLSGDLSESAPLYSEELKVVLKRMGSTQSICRTDHMSQQAPVSGRVLTASTIPVKHCNPFSTLPIVQQLCNFATKIFAERTW
jgi:hypothetical protein